MSASREKTQADKGSKTYRHKPEPFFINWDWWRRKLRWIPHPITVFVGLQVVWLATLLTWVFWYVEADDIISEMAGKFAGDADSVATTSLIVGIVLLGVILLGTIVLFIFGQKQTSLARRQRSFLSSVTHELKSPLASLQLTFETLSTRNMDDPTRAKMMRMVFTDLERLKRMVDQILIAGRLDRGIESYKDELAEVNVRDLLEEVCENFSYLEFHFMDRVSISCAPDLALETSEQALSLILSNLVENAAKYSSTGTPIKIVAGFDADQLLLSISDEGIGLGKKESRKIFNMFHRAEAAEKKAIPGTGLGLFIVRSATRALGGRVWAESLGHGNGTTFFVSLPLIESKA